MPQFSAMSQNSSLRSVVSRTLAVIALNLCAVLAPATAGADEAGDFYRGKVIRLLVGYGPGGGFDTIARVLAPRIEAVSGATVVVENRSGGGGLVALNQLYDGEPDGLSMMLVNGRAAVMSQIVEQEGVRFDLARLPWLGRIAMEPTIVMLGEESAYRTVENLRGADTPVKWSAGGKTDSLADSAAIFSEALGIPSRIIIGYKGSKESALAAMRGEVDAVMASAGTAQRMVEGRLSALAVLDRNRVGQLPDVPTVFELVSLDVHSAWWIDFWASVARFGRVLATTPGTPAERVAWLAERLASVVADPAFVAELDSMGYTVDYLAPTGVDELAARTLRDLDDSVLARIRQVVLEKYYD